MKFFCFCPQSLLGLTAPASLGFWVNVSTEVNKVPVEKNATTTDYRSTDLLFFFGSLEEFSVHKYLRLVFDLFITRKLNYRRPHGSYLGI